MIKQIVWKAADKDRRPRIRRDYLHKNVDESEALKLANIWHYTLCVRGIDVKVVISKNFCSPLNLWSALFELLYQSKAAYLHIYSANICSSNTQM